VLIVELYTLFKEMLLYDNKYTPPPRVCICGTAEISLLEFLLGPGMVKLKTWSFC